jgi:hypothetical protein
MLIYVASDSEMMILLEVDVILVEVNEGSDRFID